VGLWLAPLWRVLELVAEGFDLMTGDSGAISRGKQTKKNNTCGHLDPFRLPGCIRSALLCGQGPNSKILLFTTEWVATHQNSQGVSEGSGGFALAGPHGTEKAELMPGVTTWRTFASGCAHLGVPLR